MKILPSALVLAGLMLVSCACSVPGQQPDLAALPLGIVKEKPETGPFVETKLGYMIPYQQPIPGTNLVIEMVPVPGGTFLLGSPPDAEQKYDDETPQVRIKTPPFWMAKTEVTWGQYKPFMNLYETFQKFEKQGIRKITDANRGDAVTAPSILWEPEVTYDAGDGADTPAASMTQYSARQYTKWLSLTSGQFYRLPYEAEWEYACRAGTSTLYSFGDSEDELEDYGWFEDNSDDERQPVASKKPNPFGLYDMHGNVAEWVLDQYDEKWYSKLLEKMKSANLESLPIEQTYNRPTQVYPRVIRGGSWELDADSARSAFRMTSEDEEWTESDPNFPASPFWFSDDPAFGIGFRIVRPLIAPKTQTERAIFWDAAVKETAQIVSDRIAEEARGSIGLVDKDLPEAIKKLDNEKK